MTTMLEVTCRDPVVSRDGRPFGVGQGNRMRSLDWLLPSVVTGSLRTTLGKSAKRDFVVADARDLLQVEVAGPFPRADEQLYFPAPEDCVVHPKLGPLRAAPQPLDRGGCDWPVAPLQPVALTVAQAPDDFKPANSPAWWPEERYAAWLAGEDVAFDDRFLLAPEKEERMHVRLDPETGASEEGDLFTTSALALTHLSRYGATSTGTHARDFAAITLAARARATAWCGETLANLDTLHPLGGERRLVHWKAVGETGAWNCPKTVRDALSGAKRVRMVLATPAIFHEGWKPAWLNSELVGTPPGATVALRLVGVSIQRWRAVSGWSLADLPGQPRGAKPVKRMAPSGGVYFFETAAGDAMNLAGRWLEPMSDDEQDRRDGFGLATWGIW